VVGDGIGHSRQPISVSIMTSEEDIAQSEANALRADVINWLLAFGEISDLKAVKGDRDLGALDRSRYERRLGLPSGSLSIGRFSSDFRDMPIEMIGERLLDEAYLGSVWRSPAEAASDEIEDAPDTASRDPAERFARFLVDIDLEASKVMMLSGSGDVAAFFAEQGTATPDLRRHPGSFDVTRFALAVVCRGPLGHKDFEPWTQLIKNAGKHNGPALLTATSSNISGIIEFLHERRVPIRRYVDAWRSLSPGSH
jgi:hypothetical protein